MAALNYESGFRQFPPGTLGPDPNNIRVSIEDDGTQQYTGAMVFLLAQMEQDNIGNQIPSEYLSVRTRGVTPWFGNPILFELAQARVPSFVCPEAQENPSVVFTRAHSWLDGTTAVAQARALTGIDFGLTSYRPSGGFVSFSTVLNGVFGNRSTTDFADIEDGTSSTFLFGETSGSDDGEYSWAAGGTIDSIFGFGNSPLRWGSNHPGDLVHFSFADGSTHNIAPSLDPTVLSNLAAMADGQVVGDF